MLLGCSVFFFFVSLLMSPHVYFSLTELCSDGYLP